MRVARATARLCAAASSMASWAWRSATEGATKGRSDAQCPCPLPAEWLRREEVLAAYAGGRAVPLWRSLARLLLR